MKKPAIAAASENKVAPTSTFKPQPVVSVKKPATVVPAEVESEEEEQISEESHANITASEPESPPPTKVSCSDFSSSSVFVSYVYSLTHTFLKMSSKPLVVQKRVASPVSSEAIEDGSQSVDEELDFESDTSHQLQQSSIAEEIPSDASLQVYTPALSLYLCISLT